jgi:hypothetical protein
VKAIFTNVFFLYFIFVSIYLHFAFWIWYRVASFTLRNLLHLQKFNLFFLSVLTLIPTSGGLKKFFHMWRADSSPTIRHFFPMQNHAVLFITLT